jgi:hypothetical protein
MPFKPGKAKTGGRPKGGLNKKTLKAHALAELKRQRARDAVGPRMLEAMDLPPLDPLVVLAACMRITIEDGDQYGAAQIAGMLAPYMHARLSSSELKISRDYSAKTVEELLAEARELRQRFPAASRPVIDVDVEPAASS